MPALLRVSFEKHQSDARKQSVRALQQQVAFWMQLLAPMPDVGRLHVICAAMSDAEARAEAAFTELLNLAPQSLQVLRLYADFCLLVLNNSEKASLLLADAQRVEEAAVKETRSKDSGASLRILSESSLDIMDDDTAVITISGKSSNLGTILSANSVACRLLGYARW
jgi:hypothetical protein